MWSCTNARNYHLFYTQIDRSYLLLIEPVVYHVHRDLSLKMTNKTIHICYINDLSQKLLIVIWLSYCVILLKTWLFTCIQQYSQWQLNLRLPKKLTKACLLALPETPLRSRHRYFCCVRKEVKYYESNIIQNVLRNDIYLSQICSLIGLTGSPMSTWLRGPIK